MRHLLLITLLWTFGCEGIVTDIAEPCLTSEECIEGSLCYSSPGNVALCMATCETGTRLCAGGEVCIPVADMQNICYLGGSVVPGEPCVDGSACVAGSVCIEEGGTSLCRVACDTRTPSCPTGGTCTELAAPAGYCVPMATPMQK